MPIISRFFGIVIFMFWREHKPPHFHAKYGDDEVIVEIKNGKVSGTMSRRALELVQEWRKLHKEELMRDWELAEQKKALFPIKPLE
jgi:phosphatidylserine/phosphatidylglycerophosphate/cardiolipin synthase-like enzyme